MESDNQVLAKWDELKALFDSVELDVAKNARGVSAAGVRARKGLRALKSKTTELVKLTVDLDKARKADRPVSPVAVKKKPPVKAAKKS